MKKIIMRIVLILAIIAVLVGIGFVTYGIYKKVTLDIPNPVATMEVEGYGTIKIELYPDMAPNTVTNFIRLANRGFYNGLTFHRTIPDFMAQAGGYNDSGESVSPKLSNIMENVENDKEYNIKGEFIANGYNNNTLKHEKGVVSMARADYGNTISSSLMTEGYNSAAAQFFIMTSDATSLDGQYAAFGKVIEGYEIAEEISNLEVYYRDGDLEDDEEAPKDSNGNEIQANTPKKQPVIKSITVETYGVDYGIPETVEPFDYYTWLMQQYGLSY